MPIPPGVVGHDAGYRSSIQYDPELANRLLDRYGYRKDGDGWRRLPDGQPLVLKIQGDASGAQRPFDELWKKSLDAIGIRVEFVKGNFSDNIRAARACQVQMMGAAWGADYPDGDNFMQNFYGPNLGQSNSACYQSANFRPALRAGAAGCRIQPSATSCSARLAASWRPTPPGSCTPRVWAPSSANPGCTATRSIPSCMPYGRIWT